MALEILEMKQVVSSLLFVMKQRAPIVKSGEIFSYILVFLWNIGSSAEPQSLISQGKKRTLEELFKPPIDIMYKGDWQSARDAATAAKKWLLVNIQDAGEFQCQTLNRDVWSNEAVKTIIREHFLFWQVYYLIIFISRAKYYPIR